MVNLFYSLPVELRRKIEIMRPMAPVAEIIVPTRGQIQRYPPIMGKWWFRKLREVLAKENNAIIVAKDWNATMAGAKAYRTPLDWHSFLIWEKRVPPREKIFYEYIRKDQPTKLFFDLESRQDAPPFTNAEFHQLKHKIINIVSRGATEMHGIEGITQADFALLGSCTPTKTSYHLILKSKMRFADVRALMEFTCRYFPKGLNTDLDDIIDAAPWREGCWRMPNSSKAGQDRPMTIMMGEHGDTPTMEDCLVTCFTGFTGETVEKRRT